MRQLVARCVFTFIFLAITVSFLQTFANSTSVYGHAYLEASSPAVNQVLFTSPADIRLKFSEKVNLLLSNVTLVSDQGKQISQPLTAVDLTSIRMKLPTLASGSYRVKWKMMSVDAHVASGEFSFSLRLADRTVADTPANQDQHHHPHPAENHHHSKVKHRTWEQTLHQGLRIVDLLVITFIVGYLLNSYVIGSPGYAVPSIRRRQFTELGLYVSAICLTLLTGCLHIWHLSMQLAPGQSNGWWTLVTSTMLGQTILFKIAALVMLMLIQRLEKSVTSWSSAKVIMSSVLVLTFPLTGHAYASEVFTMAAVMFHWLHLITVIVWVSGIFRLIVESWRTDVTEELAERLHGMTVRFSVWALPLLLISGMTGIANSISKFSSLDQWWTTGYGQLLMLKSAIVALIFVIAAMHRIIWIPKLTSRPRQFIAALRVELLLAVFVFVLAGIIAVTPLPV